MRKKLFLLEAEYVKLAKKTMLIENLTSYFLNTFLSPNTFLYLLTASSIKTEHTWSKGLRAMRL